MDLRVAEELQNNLHLDFSKESFDKNLDCITIINSLNTLKKIVSEILINQDTINKLINHSEGVTNHGISKSSDKQKQRTYIRERLSKANPENMIPLQNSQEDRIMSEYLKMSVESDSPKRINVASTNQRYSKGGIEI